MSQHDGETSKQSTEARGRAYRLQRTLTHRFAAYLAPGERVSVSMEIEKDFVYSKWTVATPRMDSRIDVEAVLIAQDQDVAYLHQRDTAVRLEGVLSFLEGQLSEYFRQGRRQRFHGDWRIYDFEEAKVRFRGEWSSPDLEAQADALLGEGDEAADEF
jgi:hypothetical protein